MTKLFEIKDKVFQFCGEYETYLKYAYKFVVAFVLFCMINGTIGFMSSISSLPVALLLALICSLLPQNMTIILAGVLILLNLYTLSLEVALVALLIFILVYLIYFRFSPRDGMLFVLTPVFFGLGIPYVLPIGTGLLRKIHSATAVICGTVCFYFLNGIYQNVQLLGGNAATGEDITKFNVTISQLLGNKEMYLTIGIFALSTIVVSVIRRLSIDNAWKVAIIAGVMIQVSGLFAGYILLDVTGKAALMVVGNIVAAVLGLLIEFLFMDLDYSRTERVQFEDDDYYYFVKAIPKKMVVSGEVTIKHFGDAKKRAQLTENNKKLIAEELDIDEDLLD